MFRKGVNKAAETRGRWRGTLFPGRAGYRTIVRRSAARVTAV